MNLDSIMKKKIIAPLLKTFCWNVSKLDDTEVLILRKHADLMASKIGPASRRSCAVSSGKVLASHYAERDRTKSTDAKHGETHKQLTKNSAQTRRETKCSFSKRHKCELWTSVSGFSPEEEEEKKRFPSFSDWEMWHLARRGCFTGLFFRSDVHSYPGVMGNFKRVAPRSVGKQNINRVLPTMDHAPVWKTRPLSLPRCLE